MMRRIPMVMGLMAVVGSVLGGEQAKVASPTSTDVKAEAPVHVILNLRWGSFRGFVGWRTPTLISPDGKLKPLLEPKRKNLKNEDRKPLPVVASAPPPANWTKLDFDDSVWPRWREWVAFNIWRTLAQWSDQRYQPKGVLEGNMVCLRGEFNVSDPSQVKDLKLILGYWGGAVVYINGVELQRGDLPAGILAPDTMATRYTDDAYVGANNVIRPYDLCGAGGVLNIDEASSVEACRLRLRFLKGEGTLDGGVSLPPFAVFVPDKWNKAGDKWLTQWSTVGGVRIPTSMLRKGVNVIAIEVRAAPVNELFYEMTVGTVTWTGNNQKPFPHAMVVDARLTASSAAGLDGSETASGIQLANSQVIETVFANELVSPGVQVFPIRMVGTRNGTFSGKVVLSSAGTIRNLRAAASELTQADGGSTGSPPDALSQSKGKGRIPASDVQVRWAERATSNVSWATSWDSQGWIHFDRLLGSFPTEIPVAKFHHGRQMAVVPVWVTVRVPADAAPGEYQGTLTIEAEGKAPAKFTVPVQLKVNDWRLPDPKDFVIHHNFYQSPDSVARHYNVPMWSDKHFELMGKSLAAFKQVGNKICVVNLIADSFTLGNSEGMVRWVRKGGSGAGVQASGAGNTGTAEAGKPEPGTPNPEPYTYDFTIADKYMDLYEKTCGKPGVLRLDAWQRVNEAKAKTGQGVQNVSLLDPATGKVEQMPQPGFGTPENEVFWRPVLAELRKRLEKRGWFDVAAFGWVHYSKPADPPQLVDVFKKIWPDGKWVHTAHTAPSEYQGTTKDIRMPVLCSEGVWGIGALYNPDAGGQYPRPWKGHKNIFLGFPRMGVEFISALRDDSSLAAYKVVTEATIQGNIRGLGYLGGDFWPVPASPTDKRLVRVSYGGQGIDMSDAVRACFSPGPDGATFNGRMEMFREGVQAVEAITFLQRALEEKRATGPLEKKINDLLNERARYFLRAEMERTGFTGFESSNWQERDDRLFALCAEVAKATGK